MDDQVIAHAQKIIKAAGSNLRHYEMQSKAEIVAAVMDCWEEAYRAGASFATQAIHSSLTAHNIKEQPNGE